MMESDTNLDNLGDLNWRLVGKFLVKLKIRGIFKIF